MGFTKAHYDFTAPKNPSDFAHKLGLTNLGISIYRLKRGEGYDFFHNHREQEEIYLCLRGTADLKFMGEQETHVQLAEGDIVRVDPKTLRAIGNVSSDEALVLIAGACPHSYPAGFGHHDVINDVLAMSGHGNTGFAWPSDVPKQSRNTPDDEEC